MADWFSLGAAGIGALGQLGGGLFSASGAAQANVQAQRNQQIMFDQSQAFNLGQAEESRRLQNEQFYANQNFQANQAQQAMVWSENMSNTAYQRAMRDMRLAGLNPMLAYTQGGAHGGTPSAGGGGGGSPTSASMSASGASAENPNAELGRAIGNIASSAVDTYKTGEQAKLIDQQQKTETEATTEMRNRAQVQGQEISNRATMNHNLQQDWHIKERQKKLVEAQTDAAKASSAAGYAAAGKSAEETRQFQKHGMPGYGLGERVIRGLENGPGPTQLPGPSWPFN